jgi:hypothetical protein
MEKIQTLQFDIQKWSDETFGKHRIATPIVYHLKKEVDELIEKLEDWHKGQYGSMEVCAEKLHEIKMEFADCFMLLIDAAAHFPLTMDAIYKATEEKLEINKNRKWGQQDENGVIEHIRDVAN